MDTYQVYAMGRTAYNAYQNAIRSAIPEDPYSIKVSSGFNIVEPPIRNVPKWVEWVFAGLEIVHARSARDVLITLHRHSTEESIRARWRVKDAEKPIPKEYRELAVAAAARMQAKGDALASLITGVEADRVRREHGWKGRHGKMFVFYGVSSN